MLSFDYCTGTFSYSEELLSEAGADVDATSTWEQFCIADCSNPESLDEPDYKGFQVYWLPLYATMFLFHFTIPHWQRFRRKHHGQCWPIVREHYAKHVRNLASNLSLQDCKGILYHLLVSFILAIASTLSMTALIGNLLQPPKSKFEEGTFLRTSNMGM